jgi:hypothetical protein
MSKEFFALPVAVKQAIWIALLARWNAKKAAAQV